MITGFRVAYTVDSYNIFRRGSGAMDAAIDGFYAARDRYRKRRSLSRSGSNVGTPVHRRIVSRYSGRELQLDDDQCEQLKDAFSNIPDKYYVFEQMFLQLFKVPTACFAIEYHGF